MPDAAPDTGPTLPVTAPFVARYTLAIVGAYLCFVPLLQILVPLQAAAIDPAHSALLLSQVALWGAVVASAANILFGALSDRGRLVRGNRRRWLFAGLLGTLLSYGLIWAAASRWMLLGSVVFFQLAFNALFAPLGAVLADHVPNRQRGLVSALMALGYPLASVTGAATVGAWATGGARFLLLGTLVTATIAPFAWHLGACPAQPVRPQPVRHWSLLLAPLAHRDFACAWTGRLLVVTSFSLVQIYLLLYLRRLGAAGTLSGRPETAFAALASVATVANIICGLLGGWLSDRVGRRRTFVLAGGLLVATGIACTALAHSWAGLLLATLIYGAGAGIYYAVDLALIVQVLPSNFSAGKDLGIVNLSNTVPQAIAPLLAMSVLADTAPHYRLLFLIGATAAMAGSAFVLGIRRQGHF
jgi:MFS family permease